MKFQLIKEDCGARRGIFETVHGTVQTPAFMNVATAAAIKGGLSAEDLNGIGTQVMLCNTYHLHVRPGDDIVCDMGGLHKFTGWDKPILTDSGGFQVFSLAKLNKIKEEGVTFSSHIDGHKIFMGPEESMQIQSNLASTIAMAFDECVKNPATYKYAKEACERTSEASVYMGTGGSNPAAGMGKAISNLIASVKGSTYKSKMLDKMTFGSYNKKTEKKTPFDWLTRDESIVQNYINDEYCGFLFSAKGMNDLVMLNIWANSAEWYNTVKKDLPILVVAGADDPVGAYSKGINEIGEKLKATGHSRVTVKLFPGCRHEILNETNKQEVYEYIDAFLDANCRD